LLQDVAVRILLATHYALPHLGGIETAVDAYARQLSHAGHQVCHLASRASRPDQRDQPTETILPYRRVGIAAVNGLEARFGVPYPVYAPSLWAAVRREAARADVVHAHGYLYMSSIAALKAASTAPTRPVRVLTEHVGQVPYDSGLLMAVQRTAIATVGRWSARASEGMVALNETVDRELAALAPGHPRLRSINGVDPERHRPPTLGERERLRQELGWDDHPWVLFVGRMVTRKGLDVLLELAARESELRFAIVGPGSVPPRLPANVSVFGPQPPERVAELYRAVDVFALPSRGEGFPMTVQEAMASGLPVLLGDDGSYGTALADASPGLTLVPVGAEEFHQALRPLLRHAERREQAGARARRYALEHFAWPAIAQRQLDFYGELRERRSAGR
jgi:glycosyltransferase involved in cell wall biosynthesis